MTLPMIIALAVTVLMIILIMVDKLPFGAPPLLALLLLVVFGVTDIKTAFGGFANPTIVMLASFMAIIAALQKTSFIVKFKQTMFNMASKGGFKAYVLLILIVMLGCSLFGTGSTAYYVLVIGLLFGCRYRFSGPDLDRNKVGEVANQVSDSVRDAVGQVREQFKKEFSRSRHRKGK